MNYALNTDGQAYDAFAEPYLPPKDYSPLMDKNAMSWEKYRFPYIRTPEHLAIRSAFANRKRG